VPYDRRPQIPPEQEPQLQELIDAATTAFNRRCRTGDIQWDLNVTYEVADGLVAVMRERSLLPPA
jgi:hypothetical protein